MQFCSFSRKIAGVVVIKNLRFLLKVVLKSEVDFSKNLTFFLTFFQYVLFESRICGE